jgi:hypothetical protein
MQESKCKADNGGAVAGEWVGARGMVTRLLGRVISGMASSASMQFFQSLTHGDG